MVPFVGLKCSTVTNLRVDFKILYPVTHYHSYVIISSINHNIKLNFVGEIRHLHATIEKMLLL
jgi:hypothetical protein